MLSDRGKVGIRPGSDDVYLGVSSLLRYQKISLHKSGKFRAAFVSSYNEQLVEEGKDAEVDRAIMKWEKIPVEENEIRQVLDIHFPLAVLSLSRRPPQAPNKTLYLLQPDENSVGANDTVTAKVIFTKLHPESVPIQRTYEKRKIIPLFYMSLDNGEFLSLVIEYTKNLPIKIPKRETKAHAKVLHDQFSKSGKRIGDRIDGLTFQLFQMGMPPSVMNIGQMSAHSTSEKEFSIEYEPPSDQRDC